MFWCFDCAESEKLIFLKAKVAISLLQKTSKNFLSFENLSIDQWMKLVIVTFYLLFKKEDRKTWNQKFEVTAESEVITWWCWSTSCWSRRFRRSIGVSPSPSSCTSSTFSHFFNLSSIYLIFHLFKHLIVFSCVFRFSISVNFFLTISSKLWTLFMTSYIIFAL